MEQQPVIDLIAFAQILVWMVGIITVGFTIVGSIAFWRTTKGAAKSFSLLLQRGDMLRIITAAGIVITAMFLALARVIQEAAVVAILSGIVGYVLGGLEKNRTNTNDTEE